MGEAVSSAGRKALAVAILLVASWLLLKFVIGLVTAAASVAVVILALIAVVWAVRVL